jgi:hypothetical protein
MFHHIPSLRRLALVLAITGSLLPGIVAPLLSGGSAATSTRVAQSSHLVRIHPWDQCSGSTAPC